MFKKCINTRIKTCCPKKKKTCCSVAKLCLTLCDHIECSTPGFPVHYFLEFAQIHVHWVNDTIQPSQTLSPPSPHALSPSQLRVSWTRLSRLPCPWNSPECVAILFSRGHSHPRDRTLISCILGRCFTVWATSEALINVALGFWKFFNLLQKWVLEELWVIWKGYVCVSHSVMSRWSGGICKLSEIGGSCNYCCG